MKKALIYIAVAALTVTSCRKEDGDTTESIIKDEVKDLTVQNSNDDKAIAKYMDEHYLDASGKITRFSSTDTSDDANKKLSELNVQKLPSGVIVIVREGAQPNPGTAIGATDIISIMQRSYSFVAQENNGIEYVSEIPFANTIDGTGNPEVDPSYYYVKQSVMDASNKTRAYYEIEGFQEGLKYFKSFNLPNSANYNLQGVILVPSRAAFARDEHYPYSGMSFRNRSFVFNFQIYRTTPR